MAHENDRRPLAPSVSRGITRRQAAALASAAFVPPQARAAGTYTGALDGFEERVNLKGFDPVAWTLDRYQSAPLKLTFKATERKQAEAWQKKLRARIAQLVGPMPAMRGPVQVTPLETRDFGAYKREKFVFESRPGLHVLAYLLTPAKGKAPHPVVVCVPGHGRGVDDIVGIDDQGQDRAVKAGYQNDFAIQVAEHGLAAVAIEPMAFGCRRDARTKKGGLGRSACQPTAGAALLLGETMIGWRVFDVMRTIDWIGARKDLDASRVGVTGISGGGTITVFSSALDTRIKAAFASGYLNTFRDSIFSLSHCIDNYVPGILEWAEMYDVAGLIAPRPFFAESGTKDDIFPIKAFQDSFARVKKVYETFGAADRIDHETFEADHRWHGAKGIPFLARHLGA